MAGQLQLQGQAEEEYFYDIDGGSRDLPNLRPASARQASLTPKRPRGGKRRSPRRITSAPHRRGTRPPSASSPVHAIHSLPSPYRRPLASAPPSAPSGIPPQFYVGSQTIVRHAAPARPDDARLADETSLDGEVRVLLDGLAEGRVGLDELDGMVVRLHDLVRALRRELLEVRDREVDDVLERMHAGRQAEDRLRQVIAEQQRELEDTQRLMEEKDKERVEEVALARATAEVEGKKLKSQIASLRASLKRAQEEGARKDQEAEEARRRAAEELKRVKRGGDGETAKLEQQVKRLQYELVMMKTAAMSTGGKGHDEAPKVDEAAQKEVEALREKVKALQAEAQRKERLRAGTQQQVEELRRELAVALEESRKAGRWREMYLQARRDLQRKDVHLKATTDKLNKVKHENVDLTLEIEDAAKRQAARKPDAS